MYGTNTIARTHNGIVIEQRESDGYIDATAMCQATGKRLNNYLRNESTVQFLAALEDDTRIRATELVRVRQGGTSDQQGTWVHPDVAVHLAQWCSPVFAVQVSKWVRELMTRGSVAIEGTPIDPMDAMVEQAIRMRDYYRQQQAMGKQLAWVTVEVAETRRVADHALDVATTYTGCMTVACYLSATGRACDEATAARHGRNLSAIMRGRGLPITKLRHPKYPKGVASYPEDVLAEYFGDPRPRLAATR